MGNSFVQSLWGRLAVFILFLNPRSPPGQSPSTNLRLAQRPLASFQQQYPHVSRSFCELRQLGLQRFLDRAAYVGWSVAADQRPTIRTLRVDDPNVELRNSDCVANLAPVWQVYLKWDAVRMGPRKGSTERSQTRRLVRGSIDSFRRSICINH